MQSRRNYKLKPPKITGVVNRERLFRWLDRARNDYPIIWIKGPAGCGKTTLVQSYLVQRDLHCPWYRLDPSDGKPEVFFSRLAEAARKPQASRRRHLPDLSASNVPDVNQFALEYFRVLYERFASPLIVFDDCHTLAEDSGFYQWLAAGLGDIPEGRNVVFIGRNDPSPSFMRLYAEQSVGVLGWEDLRLTNEETQEIIAHLHSDPVCPRLEEYTSHTDGWVAGLIMMLRGLKGLEGGPPADMDDSDQYIFDYFAAEVFGSISVEMQQFLVTAALLPVITEDLASGLTTRDDSVKLLEALRRKQFFISKTNHGYSFHPLFRRFLHSRADAVFPVGTLTSLRRKAAGLLADTGHIHAAAMLYQQSGDWAGLSHLIEANASTLLRDGKSSTVEAWICTLPSALRQGAPILLYWLGLSMRTRDPAESISILDNACTEFEQDGDHQGAMLAWSACVRTCLDIHYHSRLAEIFDKGERLFSVLSAPNVESRRAYAFAMFSACSVLKPEHMDLHRWAERVRADLMSMDDLRQDLDIVYRILHYDVWFGYLPNTNVFFERLSARVNDDALTEEQRLRWLAIRAFRAWVNADFETADKCWQIVSSSHEIKDMHPLAQELVYIHALSSLGQDRIEDAHEQVLKLNVLSAGNNHLQSFRYHYLSSLIASCKSDNRSSRVHMEQAAISADKLGMTLYVSLARLSLGYILALQGAVTQAEDVIAKENEFADRCHSDHLLCVSALVQATLPGQGALRQRAHLSRAFGIACQHGYKNLYWWPKGAMTDLCARALSYEVEVPFVQSLIRQRRMTPRYSPIDVEQWPWPIRIHTLGRFSLVIDAETVGPARKAQHKPIEMLKVLIAYGGREVGIQMLESALWPDSDGDAAHKAFDTTLHRLRKLLKHEKVLVVQDGRLSLDSRYCWVDVWAFEKTLNEMAACLVIDNDELWGSDTQAQAAKVLRLYQGHFLAFEPMQAWSISLRERLRNKMLKYLEAFGKHWERMSNWEKAAGIYQRALEIDDVAEMFYQRLMVCYRELDRRGDALAVYRRCERMLSVVLNVKPTEETERLRKSLLDG